MLEKYKGYAISLLKFPRCVGWERREIKGGTYLLGFGILNVLKFAKTCYHSCINLSQVANLQETSPVD